MDTTDERVELARRTNGGIDVRLLWDAAADGLAIVVSDLQTGERREFPVPAERGLDAFHHPFAYDPA